MVARITMNIDANGELEIWLNPDERDALVKALQGLSETNDHFHFGPHPIGEVEVSERPYRLNDQILAQGKVLFRPDSWDAEHFPHISLPI